jgi:hypothetical protein
VIGIAAAGVFFRRDRFEMVGANTVSIAATRLHVVEYKPFADLAYKQGVHEPMG